MAYIEMQSSVWYSNQLFLEVCYLYIWCGLSVESEYVLLKWNSCSTNLCRFWSKNANILYINRLVNYIAFSY